MKIKEADIVYERGRAWAHRDVQSYDVYIIGPTLSRPDCSFDRSADGLSLAIARVDWHNRVPGLPMLPAITAVALAKELHK